MKPIRKPCILHDATIRILLFAWLLLIVSPVAGQIERKSINIQLAGGKYMQVQVCTERIIRVRLSSENKFPESLMEHYELIKTDWNPVEFKSYENNLEVIVNTGASFLKIDKVNGTLCLNDNQGKILLDSIRLTLTDQKAKYSEFTGSLTKLFNNELSNDIIGDSLSATEANNKNEKNRIASEKLSDLLNPLSKAGIAEFSLNKTERFYGLGSAVRDRIQQRGNAARIWPQYQRSESPIPFIMSTDGWGVFFNTSRVNYFDVGSYKPERMIVLCTDDNLDFYLMAGAMPEILDQYTTVTGKPYLMPKWAYGLAFGSNMMEDEFNILEDAYHFRQEKIPCDIYWLEPQWMEKFYDASTNKEWDPKKFYNAGFYFWEKQIPGKKDVKPDLFINRMNNMGFKIALWLNANHDLTIEEEDYLASKTGKPQSGLDHWFPHLLKFVNQGVQGFKLDPGTTMDEHPSRKYYNGFTDDVMHPLNQVLYPKQLYRTIRDNSGLRSFHHYCGGYSGIQHWTASTCGDNGGGRTALYDQLNLGLSGISNTSCDVLALGKDEPLEQGLHFGFFLPWVQINSWAAILHPWFLSPEQKKEFQFYDQLRYSLMPYLYSAAINSTLSGMPIVRAMPLVYPNDEKLENATNQYLFGDFFLVSTFTNKTYLPEGDWIDYWTGKKYNGNQEVVSDKQVHGGQLFVKSGAIIPFQKPMQFVNESPDDTLLLKVYPDMKSTFTLYEDDGTTFDYEKGKIAKTIFNCKSDGKKISLSVSKREGKYNNMPEHRIYQIEVYTDETSVISLNNQELSKGSSEYDRKIKAFKFITKIE